LAPSQPKRKGADLLRWLFGGAGVLLILLLWLRYRRETGIAVVETSVAEPGAAALPLAPSGALLNVSLRPIRAGLNILTAVADCEITVVNDGEASARSIRTALHLIAAHRGQSTDIDAVNEAPIVRPILPAFDLAPGESRSFRGIAAAPLGSLATMRAGGRNMLVPLVVLNLQHRDDAGAQHLTSQLFVLGVERADSPRLAPFWLDSVRMIDQVAARASGAPLRRRIQTGLKR
jgi:hypothetical protein